MDHLDALDKLRDLVGTDLNDLVLKFNLNPASKGVYGVAVERFLGIKTNINRAPDIGDYELKVIPFKKVGINIEPKETMAITMVDRAELTNKSFKESHLFKKINKLIICSRLVSQDKRSSILIGLDLVDLNCNHNIINLVNQDYDKIQQITQAFGFSYVSSSIGKFIQARTKGSKNSNSRAFYAKKDLINLLVNKKNFII